VFANFAFVRRSPTSVEPHVAINIPTQSPQFLQECRKTALEVCIVCGCWEQHTNLPRPLVLLRVCRERPQECCAAQKVQEVASAHLHPSAASYRSKQGSLRVRFTPNSDRESRHLQKVMSTLPLKATCAVHQVMSALGQ
jgi:hypothetical protein